MNMDLKIIGHIRADAAGFYVELAPQYRAALTGLEGFGYVQLLWWFDGCDAQEAREKLIQDKPYVNGPAELGCFATRAPERPNPLALSAAAVSYVDVDNGRVGLAWVDARDGSPLLDIKPYMPSLDCVEQPAVPAWCAHWPKCVEESGDFDWGAEFNF